MNPRASCPCIPCQATNPTFNPDELVWSYAKRTGLARNPLRTGQKLAERIHTQLAQIKADPDFGRSFFNYPGASYISNL